MTYLAVVRRGLVDTVDHVIAEGWTVPHTWAKVVNLGYQWDEGYVTNQRGGGATFEALREKYGANNEHVIVAVTETEEV